MKRKLIIALLLSLSLLIYCFSIYCFAETNDLISEQDEKVYGNYSVQDDFAPGEVLISIKKEYSLPNKEWSIDDFSGIAISSITDLMYIDNEESINWVNSGEFRQILRLELYENSKEAVLNAIEELDKLEFVRTAAPNSIRGRFYD